MNPKQMREARQREQAEKRKQQQAEKEQELLRQQAAREAEEFRRKLPPKEQRKSLTKAMGLKSSMVIGESVVMTSFWLYQLENLPDEFKEVLDDHDGMRCQQSSKH